MPRTPKTPDPLIQTQQATYDENDSVMAQPSVDADQAEHTQGEPSLNAQKEQNTGFSRGFSWMSVLLAGFLGAVISVSAFFIVMPTLYPARIPFETQQLLDDVSARLSVIERHPRLIAPLPVAEKPDLNPLTHRLNALEQSVAGLSRRTQESSSDTQTAVRDASLQTDMLFELKQALLLMHLEMNVRRGASVNDLIALVASHNGLNADTALLANLNQYEASRVSLSVLFEVFAQGMRAPDQAAIASTPQSSQSSQSNATLDEPQKFLGGLITVRKQEASTQANTPASASQKFEHDPLEQQFLDLIVSDHVHDALALWRRFPDDKRNRFLQDGKITSMIDYLTLRETLIITLDQRQRDILTVALKKGQ